MSVDHRRVASVLGCRRYGAELPARLSVLLLGALPVVSLATATGCATGGPKTVQTDDPTAPKAIEPRDFLERVALERGPDFELVDRMMDKRTRIPTFERKPLASQPAGAVIADGLHPLDDRDPFPEAVELEPKQVTIRVGVARSTYRTRTRPEVLSAVQPFIDLVQRQVNVRGTAVLNETANETYYALLDGDQQMAICHVFDYLLIRSWFANVEDNATVLLASARPANPRTGAMDRDFDGTPGTSIELIVARDAVFKSFADLKGARLALAANYVDAPGAFLTRLLADVGQPPDQPFFSTVTLRRYSKDAVIDVIKGKADVACVDQGTVGALNAFYGLDAHIRTLAVSPRYNVDVLLTSLNNVATHRTEIELTQTQLTTLAKDPEGQEVLFFFDTEGWSNYRDGDIDVPLAHFGDYLEFVDHTPVDLEPLLEPGAPVDRHTYDRLGDE